jgi:cell division septum initiation protein DivIVA
MDDNIDLEEKIKKLDAEIEELKNSDIGLIYSMDKPFIKKLNTVAKTDIDSRNLLANMFIIGVENLKQNKNKGIELLIKSAKEDSEYAITKLKEIISEDEEITSKILLKEKDWILSL